MYPARRMPLRPTLLVALIPTLLLSLTLVPAGCARRVLRLESDPPGALIYLGDEEVARTPAEIPVAWYGRYDVKARKAGYETLRTRRWVVAPPWLWPPFDILAETLPLTHRSTVRLDLKPAAPADANVVPRAQAYRRDAK